MSPMRPGNGWEVLIQRSEVISTRDFYRLMSALQLKRDRSRWHPGHPGESLAGPDRASVLSHCPCPACLQSLALQPQRHRGTYQLVLGFIAHPQLFFEMECSEMNTVYFFPQVLQSRIKTLNTSWYIILAHYAWVLCGQILPLYPYYIIFPPLNSAYLYGFVSINSWLI